MECDRGLRKLICKIAIVGALHTSTPFKVLQWELKECNPTSIECRLYVRCHVYQKFHLIHRCRARRHPTCLKTITSIFWIVQKKRKY